MLGLKSKPLAADKSDKIGRVLVFIYLALFFCFSGFTALCFDV